MCYLHKHCISYLSNNYSFDGYHLGTWRSSWGGQGLAQGHKVGKMRVEAGVSAFSPTFSWDSNRWPTDHRFASSWLKFFFIAHNGPTVVNKRETWLNSGIFFFLIPFSVPSQAEESRISSTASCLILMTFSQIQLLTVDYICLPPCVWSLKRLIREALMDDTLVK